MVESSIAPRPPAMRARLGAIVIGFEIFVVFLATLAIWGLWPHDSSGQTGDAAVAPSWTVLVLGAFFILVLVLVIGLIRRGTVGIILGYVVQALIFLGGFLNFSLFVVGPIFGLLWWYCIFQGTRLDRRAAGAESTTAVSSASAVNATPVNN